MSTIVISTVEQPSESPSEEVVQLQIIVKSEDWTNLFDRLEVWRSTTTTGPYEELTADKWRPARIPKTAGDEPASPVTGASVYIDGLDLELRVGEDEDNDITITFTGGNPITFAAAAAQVIAQGLGRVTAYVATDGTFVLEGAEAGTGGVLRVVDGEAMGLLGLSNLEPAAISYGRDARIPLVAGTESYLFSDQRGSDAYYYRTRLYNVTTEGHSEYSMPFSLGSALGISSANTATGTLDLVDVDGRPLVSREVSVYNTYQGDLVEDKLVAGYGQSQITDANGHVEFTMVRGSRMTVVVSNTNIARDIIVPSTGTTFGLLDPDVTLEDDHFKVRVPNIVTAERRSL